MFRSHLVNTRFFFTQPSLAFFDAMNFKPRKQIRLTAQNYLSEIQQHLKDDWVIVPQPRPPSPVYYLIITKKGSKVVGRLRPPFCIPFPKRHAGFEKSTMTSSSSTNNSTSTDPTNSSSETRIEKQDLIEFYHNHPGSGNSWLLVCTDRAVGCAVMNKNGEFENDFLVNFSLLTAGTDAATGLRTSITTGTKLGGEGSVTRQSRRESFERERAEKAAKRQASGAFDTASLNLSNEYDSPGFIRPGEEAPIWQDIYNWVGSNYDETLSQCCNWYARRDDWTNNVMWDQLRAMQRLCGGEDRYRKNLKRAEEAYLEANGGVASDVSESMLRQTYVVDEESIASATGGHQVGSKEAAAYQAQLARERRVVMDDPKWLIIPPSMMPQKEFENFRYDQRDEVNVVGAAGRMRFGTLEFL